MTHHLSALAQMYDDPPDLISVVVFLAVLLFFVLIIVLTVVIVVVGVTRETREKFDARKRKINLRPGFPVDVSAPKSPPENHP
jgi:heme/copper-type cytochrome/quinol oxidase subunit 2